jgi:HEPN domain-containing protein
LIPGSPEEWLARAKGDLALARAPLPEGAFYEDLCFHAQQAAEKALKSVYLRQGWSFRYVHDLEELTTGLRQNGLAVPREVEEGIVLTSYAFEARYPGVGESVTEEEYRQALGMAEEVVRWAELLVQGTAR